MVPHADFGLKDHRVIVVAGEATSTLKACRGPLPRGRLLGDDVQPTVAGEMGVFGGGRVLLEFVVGVCARLGNPIITIHRSVMRSVKLFEPDNGVSGFLRCRHDETRLSLEVGSW